MFTTGEWEKELLETMSFHELSDIEAEGFEGRGGYNFFRYEGMVYCLGDFIKFNFFGNKELDTIEGHTFHASNDSRLAVGIDPCGDIYACRVKRLDVMEEV